MGDLLAMQVLAAHPVLAVAVHVELVARLALVLLTLGGTLTLQLLQSMGERTLTPEPTLAPQLPVLAQLSLRFGSLG